MRQVFSSPRLENVERVAQLLRDAGIEVRVTEGRSYKGNRRGTFSYREDGGAPRPAVWVVRSDQQVQARELLRGAGLIDSTRDGSGGLPFRFEPASQAGVDATRRRATRIKLVLLGAIAIGIGLVVMRAMQTPIGPVDAPGPYDGSVKATMPQVARAVFVHEMANAKLPVLCLSVDGRDASRELIAGVARKPFVTVPGSHCRRVADSDTGSVHPGTGGQALLIEATRFRPGAPDAGTVESSAYHHQMYGSYKTLEVKRVEGEWKVTRVLRHVAMQGPLIIE